MSFVEQELLSIALFESAVRAGYTKYQAYDWLSLTDNEQDEWRNKAKKLSNRSSPPSRISIPFSVDND